MARSAEWIRASWLSQRPAFAGIGFGSASGADLDGDLLPDAWEMEHFGSIHRGNGIDGTDTIGNGVPDLLAFATGVDPMAADGFPFVELVVGPGEAAPAFSYDQIAGGVGTVGVDYEARGLRYVAEFSSDLVNWTSGAEIVAFTGLREPLGNGMERVRVRFLGETEGRLFARLRVAAAVE
jgi:hypothetical protein